MCAAAAAAAARSVLPLRGGAVLNDDPRWSEARRKRTRDPAARRGGASPRSGQAAAAQHPGRLIALRSNPSAGAPVQPRRIDTPVGGQDDGSCPRGSDGDQAALKMLPIWTDTDDVPLGDELHAAMMRARAEIERQDLEVADERNETESPVVCQPQAEVRERSPPAAPAVDVGALLEECKQMVASGRDEEGNHLTEETLAHRTRECADLLQETLSRMEPGPRFSNDGPTGAARGEWADVDGLSPNIANFARSLGFKPANVKAFLDGMQALEEWELEQIEAELIEEAGLPAEELQACKFFDALNRATKDDGRELYEMLHASVNGGPSLDQQLARHRRRMGPDASKPPFPIARGQQAAAGAASRDGLAIRALTERTQGPRDTDLEAEEQAAAAHAPRAADTPRGGTNRPTGGSSGARMAQQDGVARWSAVSAATRSEWEALDSLPPERVRQPATIVGLGAQFGVVRTELGAEWEDKAGGDTFVTGRLLERVSASCARPLAVGQKVQVSARRARGRKEGGVEIGRYRWVATALEQASQAESAGVGQADQDPARRHNEAAAHTAEAATGVAEGGGHEESGGESSSIHLDRFLEEVPFAPLCVSVAQCRARGAGGRAAAAWRAALPAPGCLLNTACDEDCVCVFAEGGAACGSVRACGRRMRQTRRTTRIPALLPTSATSSRMTALSWILRR